MESGTYKDVNGHCKIRIEMMEIININICLIILSIVLAVLRCPSPCRSPPVSSTSFSSGLYGLLGL